MKTDTSLEYHVEHLPGSPLLKLNLPWGSFTVRIDSAAPFWCVFWAYRRLRKIWDEFAMIMLPLWGFFFSSFPVWLPQRFGLEDSENPCDDLRKTSENFGARGIGWILLAAKGWLFCKVDLKFCQYSTFFNSCKIPSGNYYWVFD